MYCLCNRCKYTNPRRHRRDLRRKSHVYGGLRGSIGKWRSEAWPKKVGSSLVAVFRVIGTVMKYMTEMLANALQTSTSLHMDVISLENHTVVGAVELGLHVQVELTRPCQSLTDGSTYRGAAGAKAANRP